jgi:hypothetical protein
MDPVKRHPQPPKPAESGPHRRHHDAFIAKALASREEAKQTGVYFDAREVLDELRARLEQRVRQNS